METKQTHKIRGNEMTKAKDVKFEKMNKYIVDFKNEVIENTPIDRDPVVVKEIRENLEKNGGQKALVIGGRINDQSKFNNFEVK